MGRSKLMVPFRSAISDSAGRARYFSRYRIWLDTIFSFIDPRRATSGIGNSNPAPGSQHDLNVDFRQLNIGSNSQAQTRESRNPSQNIQGSSGSAGGENDSGEWALYAADSGQSGLFACTWREGGILCNYAAAKHSVKRHVESKHLQIK